MHSQNHIKFVWYMFCVDQNLMILCNLY